MDKSLFLDLISLPQLFLDLFVNPESLGNTLVSQTEPGHLVGKHLDVPVHCDGTNTVLDVAKYCTTSWCQKMSWSMVAKQSLLSNNCSLKSFSICVLNMIAV